MSLVETPKPGTAIVEDGKATAELQQYFEALEVMLNQKLLDGILELSPYTVAALPVARTGGVIYVSDETGGAVPAFSDGTNWRRMTDRAVVS